MTISAKTLKMLWGRAASRCSLCRMELVMDATLTDDESVVGEACHIVAREADGPRGQSDLDQERRDKYHNLILLCSVHHKQIDDQVNEFTVDKLFTIKSDHEAWVRQQLRPDARLQQDDEIYASYLDEWERRLEVNDWKKWASWTFSAGQPRLSVKMDRALSEIPEWLLSRIWPKRYPDLEEAFVNFRVVCRDYLQLFHEDATSWGDDFIEVEKFYKSRLYDEDRYHDLLDLYEAQCALIEDLMLELTRSANLIGDFVRETFLPSYRLKEGACLVTAGPFMPDLAYRTYRPEYRGAERATRYRGLVAFLDDRLARDFRMAQPDHNQILRDRGPVARLIRPFPPVD